jgi:hypothetical protein
MKKNFSLCSDTGYSYLRGDRQLFPFYPLSLILRAL